MRLAIMQPYFLPYIGYFQLLTAVDKLVLLDDVNFINRGWINRNRIALEGKVHWLTIPLVKASQNRLINAIEISPEPAWRRKMIRKVELGYRDAPFAHKVLPLFSQILTEARGLLAPFLYSQLRRLTHYLGIQTMIEPTSSIYPKEGRSAAERILDICRREGATTYVNLPGGRELYDPKSFAAAGVELQFLAVDLRRIALRHRGNEGPSLSILDLLMLNPPASIREALAPAQT